MALQKVAQGLRIASASRVEIVIEEGLGISRSVLLEEAAADAVQVDSL